MADEQLRQFYNRAARTLSIAYESFQKLKSEGSAGAEVSLTRLELELDTWNSEVAALERYNAAVQDFNTEHASWRHSGIGEPPEGPGWPSEVPNFRPAAESLLKFSGSPNVNVDNGLRFNIAQIRESLKESWPIDRDLPSMALMLQVIGLKLDQIKQKLEQKPIEVQQKSPLSIIEHVIEKLRLESIDRASSPVLSSVSAQDSEQKIQQRLPDNVDVRDLCKRLEESRQQIRSGAKSEIGIAREMTREPIGKSPKADNLLRQARRYPHLWK